MSYGNFSVAYYFVVECVAGLDAVYYLSFLVIAHTGHHGNSLVIVYIEIFVLCLDLLDTKAFEGFAEFIENYCKEGSHVS